MRKPQGYATLIDPGAPRMVEEFDTRTCSHCGRIDHVKPFSDGTDLGGFCRKCSGLICQRCAIKAAHTGRCRPQEQWMREMEERHRRAEARLDALRSYGL